MTNDLVDWVNGKEEENQQDRSINLNLVDQEYCHRNTNKRETHLINRTFHIED
jgi:hypothetical protein